MKEIDDETSEDIRGSTRYTIDPSVVKLRKKFVKRGIKRVPIYPDPVTKWYYENLEIPIREDYRHFVKMYYDEDTEKEIFKLNPSSFKLLFYIMKHLKMDDNTIYLTSVDISKRIGMSIPSFDRAKRNLVQSEWIYRTTSRNLYTINLCRFAKGSVENVIRKYDIEIEREKFMDNYNKRNKDDKTNKGRVEGEVSPGNRDKEGSI